MTRHILGATASMTLVLAGGTAYAAAVPAAGHPATPPPTVYVVNAQPYSGGTVTPIDSGTNIAGPGINVGEGPIDIAITPDGSTAYVANDALGTGSGTVTPIATATNTAGTPIIVGTNPFGLAITPAAVPHERTGPIISGHRITKCVTDFRGSRANGPHVVIWTCGQAAGQKWTISSDGTIRVNGKCLTTNQGHRASHGMAQLAACTGALTQQWLTRNGSLVNLASGKCLDDPAFNVTNGTCLDIRTCTGRPNQWWELP
jgi:YVTN family beta-propeller protein